MPVIRKLLTEKGDKKIDYFELIVSCIVLATGEVLNIFNELPEIQKACRITAIITLTFLVLRTMLRISNIEKATSDTQALIRTEFSHLLENASGFVAQIEDTGNHFLDFRGEYYVLNGPLQYELTNHDRLRSHVDRLKSIEPSYYYPIFSDPVKGPLWKKGIKNFFTKLMNEPEFKGASGKELLNHYRFYVPNGKNEVDYYPWSLFVGYIGEHPLALIYLHQEEFFSQTSLIPKHIIGVRSRGVVTLLRSQFSQYSIHLKEIIGVEAFLQYLDSETKENL